ncbi:MAG: ATP synthase F1 subunit delta [Candidatus Margulisbacteria bacterium]|nr:ATP synthase F1 subunit delta [Candidatus Margulisiibacteriota bacterium]
MLKGKFSLNYEQLYREAQSSEVEVKLEDELYSFSRLLNEHYDFKLFLEDPRITQAYKKKCLAKLLPEGISDNFVLIVHMLIDHGREEMIEELSLDFTKRLAKEKGILFGRVRSVYKIPRELAHKLQQVMQKLTKSQVKLRYEIDGTILGGLAVHLINGEVWDVSLKHKLDDIRSAILK